MLNPIMITFKKFENVWNKKNVGKLMQYYGEDILYVDSAMGKREIHSREKFSNFVSKLWHNHPNIEYNILGYKFKGFKGTELCFDVTWLAKEDNDSWKGVE